MGPRFVNVEYNLRRRPVLASDPCFNGATFCERGIRSVADDGTTAFRVFQWGHVL